MTLRNLRFLALLLASVTAAHAQSYYTGTDQTLGSGFSSPNAATVDTSGDVFVADYGNCVVKEILAVNGLIPAVPTIKTITTAVCPYGVGLAANGDLYVAGTGTPVQRLTAASGYTASTLINQLPNASNVYDSPYAVAIDASGDLFVAHNLNKMIEEVVAVGGSIPASPTIRTWGPSLNYTGGGAFSFLTSIAVDKSGNVFVTDGQLKELVAVGGTLPAQPTLKIITGTTGDFNQPNGVTVDASGNLFVSDDYSYVWELFAANNYASSIKLNGGVHTDDLFNPTSIAIDTHGNFFVAEPGVNLVKEFNVNPVNFGTTSVGSTGSTIAVNIYYENVSFPVGYISVLTTGSTGLDFTNANTGTCTLGGTSYTDVHCTVNVTFKPTRPGLRQGVVEIMDTSGAVIGRALLQGTGTAPQLAFSAPAPTTLITGLASPKSLATDASGNLYIANQTGNTITQYTATSNYTTARSLASGWTNPAIALNSSGDLFYLYTSSIFQLPSPNVVTVAANFYPPNAFSNTLNNPVGLAVDSNGNLFIAEAGSNDIKEILLTDPYNAITLASIASPSAIALDSSNNLFVATSTGKVYELLASAAYATPNLLTSALTAPTALALDPAGNLYLTDPGTSTVQELLAPAYTTLLTLASGLTTPSGLALDPKGNLYVASTSNNSILKIDLADAPSLTFPVTGVGSTSPTQTITLSNTGNATLTFPVPSTGSNPGISANFAVASGGTCPAITTSSKAAGTLATASSCTLPISFVPTTSGSISGSLILTDTALNASYATQTLALTGTAGTVTATTTTLTSSLNPSTTGQSVTLTATIAATSGSPAGTVQFAVNGTPAGSAVNLTSGAATYATTTLPVGSDAITAAFTPTSGTLFGSSTGSLTQVVNAPTPTITFTIPNHSFGDAPFTLTATSNSAAAFTYSVISGPATISGSTLTLTGAGTIVVQAAQPAYGTLYAAGSKQATFTVAPATPTIALVSTSGPILALTNVTLTATVSSHLATPTGTVTFTDGSSTLGTATLAAGTATFSTTTLATGSHSFTAIYSGDTNFLTVTSSSNPLTVEAFALAPPSGGSSTQTIARGATATFSLAVTPQGGSTFLAPIAFSASGLPTGTTATFSPQSIAAGASATNVTLSFVVPQTARLEAPHRLHASAVTLATLTFGFLLLPLFKRRKHLLSLACITLAFLSLSGCNTTPTASAVVNNYTITVTGTSNTFTSTTTLTLTVN